MTVRKYTSRSQQTTLTSAVTSGGLTINVANASILFATVPAAEITGGATFTIVLDPDTALEEIVEVTGASSNTLTITRSVDAVGTATDHSAGAVVRHMVIGRDLREANEHIEASSSVHGLTSTSGVVVGTAATQTLTNKTLTTPIVAGATLSGAITSTATITGGTLTGAIVTGLTSTGLGATQATPKNYVDAILVLQIASQTAAATSASSAATSASSAATSASSASTSASSAATSATSAAASATTAANSVATIATSASSAATSASSASTSASSAATSASSASTSASSALTSQTAAATSASSASTSASSAATSASSASTEATAASTSATSAAASATAASTSAASAATSASAALTSASSAAASATAAATSASSAATSASSAAASTSAAATSAASAATSATSADNSATAASTSATSAATSASSAGTSAASAATSQSAASTSAASAATSATAAATSASSAATSASSAATTYDDFDDRYLGNKSTPPTVDNDGNTLLVGAIYWDSTQNKMYVWSGSIWVQIATTSVYTAPTLGSTTIDSATTYSTITGLTLSGGLVSANPTVDLGIASKQYVDEVAEGLRVRPSVRAATTSNLSANYYNGPANNGVGATLTADTNRAFSTLDGVTSWSITSPPMGILVKNQTNKAQNGRYNLTTLGSGSEPWVLTRCGLCDESDEIPGSYSFVQLGTVNEGTGWVQIVADPDTFVIGTDDINVYQFSGSTYTAGDGLTLTGTVFSVATSYTDQTNINAVMGVY